jgi:hypothetical protein
MLAHPCQFIVEIATEDEVVRHAEAMSYERSTEPRWAAENDLDCKFALNGISGIWEVGNIVSSILRAVEVFDVHVLTGFEVVGKPSGSPIFKFIFESGVPVVYFAEERFTLINLGISYTVSFDVKANLPFVRKLLNVEKRTYLSDPRIELVCKKVVARMSVPVLCVLKPITPGLRRESYDAHMKLRYKVFTQTGSRPYREVLGKPEFPDDYGTVDPYLREHTYRKWPKAVTVSR